MRQSLWIVAFALFAMTGRAETPTSRPAMAPVVALRVHPADLGADNANAGILIRELFRQSLLMTARDDLGWRTRDAALFEGMPTDPAAVTLDLAVRLNHDGEIELEAFSAANDSIWKSKLARTTGAEGEYAQLVALAHEARRTSFPAALKAVGVTKLRPAADTPTSRPALSGDRLAEYLLVPAFPPQLYAVRELHARMTSDHVNSDDLDSIVRAYSHLGAITSHHWDCVSDVFAARALLYAERFMQSDVCEVRRRRARAYARAWAGLHGDAIADMVAADAAETAMSSPCERPQAKDWAEIAKLLCLYDYVRTRELVSAEGPFRGLAGLVELDSYLPEPTSGAMRSAARRALAAGWANTRAAAALGDRAGISDLSVASLLYLRAAEWQALSLSSTAKCEDASSVKLTKMDIENAVLPGTVRDAVWELRQAGSDRRDAGEPSWGAAAHVAEESAFLAALLRASLLARSWAIDSSEFVDAACEVLSEHRFAGLLRRFHTGPGPADVGDLGGVFSSVNGDVTANARVLFQEASEGGGNAASVAAIARAKAIRQLDNTARDLHERISVSPVNEARLAAVALGRTSPNNPTWACWALRSNDDLETAAALQAGFDRSPIFVYNLSVVHRRLGRTEDEERWLRRYIDLVPAVSSYIQLADFYLRTGRQDRWLETLKAGLADGIEDSGLEAANVRIKIADFYSNGGRHEVATEFARQAAESASQASYECAQRCAERAGLLEEAEKWVRASSERYTSSAGSWVRWCVKNRRGDRDAAYALFRATHLRRGRAESVLVHENLMVTALAVGKTAEAMQLARAGTKLYGSPYCAIWAAVIAIENGAIQVADEALQFAADAIPTYRYPGGHAIGEYQGLVMWLQKVRRDGVPDAAELERLLPGLPASRKLNFCIIGQRILQRANDPKAGDLLKIAAESGPAENVLCMWAGSEMTMAGRDFVPPPTQDEILAKQRR